MKPYFSAMAKQGRHTSLFTPQQSMTTAFLLIYAALSWLNYLSLDGVNAPEIFKKKLFKKPPKRKMGDMIDYVDEKVVSFEELDDDERTAASFVANLIAAVLFLIPCIIFTLSK